jgi:hypothetical protein
VEYDKDGVPSVYLSVYRRSLLKSPSSYRWRTGQEAGIGDGHTNWALRLAPHWKFALRLAKPPAGDAAAAKPTVTLSEDEAGLGTVTPVEADGYYVYNSGRFDAPVTDADKTLKITWGSAGPREATLNVLGAAEWSGFDLGAAYLYRLDTRKGQGGFGTLLTQKLKSIGDNTHLHLMMVANASDATDNTALGTGFGYTNTVGSNYRTSGKHRWGFPLRYTVGLCTDLLSSEDGKVKGSFGSKWFLITAFSVPIL